MPGRMDTTRRIIVRELRLGPRSVEELRDTIRAALADGANVVRGDRMFGKLIDDLVHSGEIDSARLREYEIEIRDRRKRPPGAWAESELQAEIELMCDSRDLRHFHAHQSSDPGFPDLVIVGPRAVMYRELKIGRKRVTRNQLNWIDALVLAGQDADIWRTDDLASGRVKRELDELAIRAPEDTATSIAPTSGSA